MSDKDHQDTQAKKEETTDDGEVTPENYSLSLDDSTPIEDLPEWARNDPKAKEAPQNDHLAWLDGTESGSSSTEMPTLHHPGKPARAEIEEPDTPVSNRPPAYLQGLDDSQPLDNLDDAMAWLDKLSASKGEPLE